MKESTKTLRRENEYNTPTTPCTSPEVRSRNSSPSGFVNINSTNDVNSGQGSPTTQKNFPSASRTSIMAGTDIKLPIFNGNGLEYLE